MPKISSYPSGSPKSSSDKVVVARAGTTKNLDGDDFLGVTLNAIQVYIADDTWTMPDDLHHIIIEVVGGGGGGGGVTGVLSQCACGNGGGGGAYKRKMILEAALAATVAVTVGPGGAGGAAGNNPGADGSASVFGAQASSAPGTGGNGQAASATLPRAGQAAGGKAGDLTGANGDVNIPGKNAVPGQNWTTSSITPSTSGSSHLSGDVIATGGAATDQDGPDGVQYGGGGGGARSSDDGTDRAGGDGADGVVIVYEYTIK